MRSGGCYVFTMSLCPDVCPVTTWACPQGGRVHTHVQQRRTGPIITAGGLHLSSLLFLLLLPCCDFATSHQAVSACMLVLTKSQVSCMHIV